jgi:purine-binding chemotaxis protein CheW
MSEKQFVVLSLDQKKFAVYLPAVERIVNAVEITQLPKAPEIICGIINYQGNIIPVINTRKIFSLPERDIDLKDKLVIANTAKRKVILIADAVHGIIEQQNDELIKSEKIAPGINYIDGVINHDEDLIMIYDLDSFLSLDEENKLNEIITA